MKWLSDLTIQYAFYLRDPTDCIQESWCLAFVIYQILTKTCFTNTVRRTCYEDAFSNLAKDSPSGQSKFPKGLSIKIFRKIVGSLGHKRQEVPEQEEPSTDLFDVYRQEGMTPIRINKLIYTPKMEALEVDGEEEWRRA